MTGAISWEGLIWMVGVVLAAGSMVAGFLFWVWRLVNSLNDKLDERESAAVLQRERAKMVEEVIRKEMADHKVHSAETFATKEGVSAAVGRVESAVDRLTGRIDRLLETPARKSCE